MTVPAAGTAGDDAAAADAAATAATADASDVGASVVTVADVLCEARACGVDRLDAHLLLGAVLGRPRAWLIAHDEHRLDADTVERFRADLARRADGVPVAYLLGQKEFHGLALTVTPDVLVPRPETETLVDWALEVLADMETQRSAGGAAADHGPLRVVDLGTGSGAIALAIADACRRAGRPVALCATDRSRAALAVARVNGERLGLDVEWLESDWWRGLEGRAFDLVVSNPPYVAAGDAHLDALRHEPVEALVSGNDGLHDLRSLLAEAPSHLRPGGWLLVEHGHDQAGAVRELLDVGGFAISSPRSDLSGVVRCSGGSAGGAFSILPSFAMPDHE